MEKKITKTDLFPNPLFMIEDLIDDIVRLQLIKDCYSWKESSPGRQVSNFGGWHSDNLLCKREENSFKFLSKKILDNIFIVNNTIDSSLFKDAKNVNINAEGWVNINQGFDFNAPHYHAGYTCQVHII